MTTHNNQIRNPRVSIITVVLNDSVNIRRTINSVISQKYPSIEFIIVDGGSTDGTFEVIHEYKEKITKLVSEDDDGIYDAMNKGINLITGEWCCFLNSGDVFNNETTIVKTISQINDTTCIIFGDTLIDYGSFLIYKKAGSMQNLWKGMPFSHQSLFIKSKILKEYRFDTSFSISSDLDLMFRSDLFRKGFIYTGFPISVYDAKGISNKFMIKGIKENRVIYRKYSGVSFRKELWYLFTLAKVQSITLLRIIIPEKIYLFFIRVLRKGIIKRK